MKDTEDRVTPNELWEHYYPRLRVFVASFAKLPSAEHEDLVSEILVKAITKLDTYKQTYSLSTWIYNIAKNHCIDAVRKTGRAYATPPETLDKHAADQPDVIDDIIAREELDTCKRAIDSLKERDRRLVFLKYYEGLNSKEIALLEGINANTVRQRLMVIKAYVKKVMEDDYEIE
ncbi:MAG: sigma-70 family RNA polymerase sigma factor [Spirochaetaceae bacterium]|jgi:RNA polymerase sigma-70 factor (ECF subfamily)|nr:sigma-70 family RNA polymerase sigma factor [Spirochaetaceae bacterium]